MEQLEQKANLVKIEAALAKISVNNVYTACSSTFDPDFLLPEERAITESFKSIKRSRQFVTGRVAARTALKQLDSNSDNHALIRNSSGLVNWPEGVAGSISHSKDIAIAAICYNKNYLSIGVDLEFYRSVSSAAIERIADKRELDIVQGNDLSKFFLIFSAKESLFKALFPLVNMKFGFNAVNLVECSSNSNGSNVLKFSIEKDLSSKFCQGHSILIRAFAAESFCLTICTLPGLSCK